MNDASSTPKQIGAQYFYRKPFWN